MTEIDRNKLASRVRRSALNWYRVAESYLDAGDLRHADLCMRDADKIIRRARRIERGLTQSPIMR